ncbi:MAG: HEAT repeat domain-containing protein [Planctomycetota bacterium]
MAGSTRNAGLAILALLLLVAPTMGADAEAKKLKAFSAQMKGADPAQRVALIRDLAKTGLPGAGKAISRYMTDRDSAVRIAAIESEGDLGNARMLGKLLSLTKTYDKDPETLAAVLHAVGKLGKPAALKTLKSLGRKWLPKNSTVASAAAEALGRIPDRTSVELLIRMLEQTDPHLAASAETDISAETRQTLRASRPAIVAALQHLTCWDFSDAEAWQRFWKSEQRRWKHKPCDRDLSELATWRDPGYGFSLERPGETWVIHRDGARKEYRVYFEKREKDAVQAAVWVRAVRNRGGLSAAVRAEESLDRHRSRMKDVREESVVQQRTRISGHHGEVLSFTGMGKHGTPIKVEERIVIVDGMMFIVGAWRRTGLPESVAEEVKGALDSFTLFD